MNLSLLGHVDDGRIGCFRRQHPIPSGFYSHLWPCSLTYFVSQVLEIMESDTTSVRMPNGGHLGEAKMSKKDNSLRPIDVFNELPQRKKVFAEWKKKAWSTNTASFYYFFAKGLRFSIWLFCCVRLTTSTHDIDFKFSGVKKCDKTRLKT